MSQVRIRRLLIVLLVCLSETLAETGNSAKRANNYILNDEHGEIGNDGRNDLIVNELSTESSVSSREDSDPVESSETIVYNRFANPPEDEEPRSSEDEEPEAPADHAIPYSEHESPKEPPTKPRYTVPGQWAKPTKPRAVSSEEVPSRLYAQVRRTHTVRRLPRKKAFENVDSEEERENAARLRKVVRNSKVNTVYTEEGYEDSAYDHAGHARDADFDEDYARKVQQQLNSRTKSRDGDKNRKNSRKSERRKKIDPEEIEEDDEDDQDDYDTSTVSGRAEDDDARWTNSAYPKSVAESGVQKLREDLDREVEEIEKSVEIGKLGSSRQESVTAPPRKDDYREKRKKNRDKGGRVREQTQSQDYNVENYPTTKISVEYEETTMANNIEVSTNGPPEVNRYELAGASPAESEMVDFQGAQNPTTVSYSQLFWDYFKAQQNLYTTLNPLIDESATSPNVLLASSAVDNAFAPYSAFSEFTTQIPNSAILNHPVSAQTLSNPRYPEQQELTVLGALDSNERDFKWQLLNVPPKTEASSASDFVVGPTSNLDSEEASFEKTFSNPIPTHRKPRYKITMRYKSGKPAESSETATSNPVDQDRRENGSLGSMTLNPNYVKMLMHLRNEDGAKKYSSPPRNNLYLPKWMRPPMPQKDAFYQNFIPHNHYGTGKLGPPSFRAGPASLVRRRNLQPSGSLLPPAIADHRGRKENDYANPKRNRYVHRYRPAAIEAISRSRAKRRERRSPGWESGVETGGSATAAKPSANNAASNRGEIERAAKNSLAAAKRNPRRKVTRGVEVGLVPDTIGSTAGRPIGKKSRTSENDRGEWSRGSVVGGVSVGEGESVAFDGSVEDGRKDGEIPSELQAFKNDEEKVRIAGASVRWNGSDEGKKLGMRIGWREAEEGLDRTNGTIERGKKMPREVEEGLNRTSGSVGRDKKILREVEGLNLTGTSGTIGYDEKIFREVEEDPKLRSETAELDGKMLREVEEGLNRTRGSVGRDKKILKEVEEGLKPTWTSEATEHDKQILTEVEGLNLTGTSGTIGYDEKIFRGMEEDSKLTSGTVELDGKMLREVEEGLNRTRGSVGRDKKILKEVEEGLKPTWTSEATEHDKKILTEVEGLNLTGTSGTIGYDEKIFRGMEEDSKLTSGTVELDGKMLREVEEGLNRTRGSVGRDKKILKEVDEGLKPTRTSEVTKHDKKILRGVGEGFNLTRTSGTMGHNEKISEGMEEGLSPTSETAGLDGKILREVEEGLKLTRTSEAIEHNKKILREMGEGFNLTRKSGAAEHDKKKLQEVEEGLSQVYGSVGFDSLLGITTKGLNITLNKEGNPDSKPKNEDRENVKDNIKINVARDKQKIAIPGNVSEESITSKVNEKGINITTEKREKGSETFLEDQKENERTVIIKELLRSKRSRREIDSETHPDSNKTDEADDLYQKLSKSSHFNKLERRDVEEVSENQEENRSVVKSHEDLLQESPQITDDVIEKEIEAHFNDNEKQEEDTDENDEDKNVEAEVPEIPDFDYVEEITEEEDTDAITTTEVSVDKDKYPFYENEKLPTASALRYATNPRKVPLKTYGRMNFYKSRDVYKHCDEVEPNLDVLPEEEKPIAEKGANENPQRLKGLGDKLDCFKAKYFDDDPFDNPLFLEKEVEDPLPPLEVNPKKFASRIMLFPKEDDQNVVQKSSKRPENHQNHKNQSRQRKPKTASARVPRTRRVRIKSYSRPVAGSRPRVIRIKSNSMRYPKSRRPQKIVRRPVSSASEVSSLYTPYQNQVYEDVMGTIKNMANSYQVEEITTVPTSKEIDVTEIDIVKTNTSSNSTKAAKKEKDRKSSSSEEHSSSSDAKVESMPPPRHFNRHRTMYKRIRVPQKSKSRLQYVQVKRPIAYRQRIIRYKRGTGDDEFSDRSAELLSVGIRGDSEETVSSEENVARIEEKQDKVENNGTSKTFSKERSKVPKTVASSDSGEKGKPPKMIYTIKDRIRYSKPKGEIRRVGKFTDKSEDIEDHRRKEPKYNYIKRKKPVSVTTTTESSLTTSTEPYLIATTHRIVEENSRELIKENKMVDYFLNDTQSGKLNSPIGESDPSSTEPSPAPTDKTGNGYAVHENLSEEQATTQQPPEVSRLNSFLGFVSPSYADFSSEEFEKSIFSNDTKGSNSPLNLTESKESLEKENNAPKTVHHSYFSDEESSEKAESNAKAEPSKESSEEGSASRNNDSKEGRTFFSYWNRPSSPAENYEDEKYKDLGPRINKPAFFHPPFSFLKSRKSFFGRDSEEDSEESDEKENEEKDYVFPWQRDKKDEKKRRKRNRYRDKATGDYEYPWERRERLARKNKRLAFDDEEDGARSAKYRRNASPRGKIRYWTRKGDSSEESDSDNVESSSETRPVKKYSSNYRSKKVKLPEADAAASVESKKVEEISRSIKEILEGDAKSSEEKSKETLEDSEEKKTNGRGVSRGIVPEDVTLAPRRSEKKEASRISLEPAAKNRSSNGSLRNLLDNGESRLATIKTNQDILNTKRERNSTLQQSKRRRRPAKTLSNVETTTRNTVNRGRRKHKMATLTISTTAVPKPARRKSFKLLDELKDVGLKNKSKSSTGDFKVLDSSIEKNGTMEHRGNVTEKIDTERKSQINKGKDELKKSTGLETKEKEVKDKLNEGSRNVKALNSESEAVDKGEDTGDNGGGGDEVGESKETATPVNDDGKFDFMDERIEALSDFAKSDAAPGDEFGFDTIMESDGGVIPHNRATQLSQQESREIISTKSWISQNYNF